MALPAQKITESKELTQDEQALIDHIGELLAEEYVAIMKKEETDESSDLCQVLKREPERTKHR